MITTNAPSVTEDERTETEDGPVAHIVKTPPGESAAGLVTEARIYGLPVEALCGHVWVPSRNPEPLPRCARCVSVYETFRIVNGGLDAEPGQ